MTRVLVVDDEAPMRRALETNLRARRYEVDLASTGEQALDLAARRSNPTPPSRATSAPRRAWAIASST